MNRIACTIGLLASLAVFTGCPTLQTGVYKENVVTPSGEPAYITIQHCLVGVRDGLPTTTRSAEDAEILANELFAKAQSGEMDFDAMVRKHTDDSPPGIYKMANHGYESDTSSRISSRQVHDRTGMVAGFGDVGFGLKVGEYGMAPYDSTASPFGYHIIKRLN